MSTECTPFQWLEARCCTHARDAMGIDARYSTRKREGGEQSLRGGMGFPLGAARGSASANSRPTRSRLSLLPFTRDSHAFAFRTRVHSHGVLYALSQRSCPARAVMRRSHAPFSSLDNKQTSTLFFPSNLCRACRPRLPSSTPSSSVSPDLSFVCVRRKLTAALDTQQQLTHHTFTARRARGAL